MKIYTKRGDLGETDLISSRVSKSNIAIHLVGELDEASARLAECKKYIEEKNILNDLSKIDHLIFTIASIIVDDKQKLNLSIDVQEIAFLEASIDEMDKHLQPLKKFITYDGVEGAIKISLLRAQIRRIERLIVDYPVQPVVLKYLNRLSDYLFTLMRYLNLLADFKEVTRN